MFLSLCFNHLQNINNCNVLYLCIDLLSILISSSAVYFLTKYIFNLFREQFMLMQALYKSVLLLSQGAALPRVCIAAVCGRSCGRSCCVRGGPRQRGVAHCIVWGVASQ